MVPMTKLMNMHFAGAHLMTGLPEYRNGGLLVDTGLLTLKEKDLQRGLEIFHQQVGDGKAVEVVPMFQPNDDVVVEWRAVTVGFLDELLPAVNKGLGLEGANALTLAQVLEAGTWKVTFPLSGRCPMLIDFREAEKSHRYPDQRNCFEGIMTRDPQSEVNQGLLE